MCHIPIYRRTHLTLGTPSDCITAVVRLFLSPSFLSPPYQEHVRVCCICTPQLAKKGSNTKLVIKLAEHSGTGLVVVEGGVEKDANGIQEMIDTIQVQLRIVVVVVVVFTLTLRQISCSWAHDRLQQLWSGRQHK